MTELLGLSLAALMGLALGLLGGGGSILTVPLLVYGLGFEPKTAIAMSLPIVGATSLLAAIGHWRAGNVRPQTALQFGLAAMGGAFGGARLAGLLSGPTQLTLLAAAMLAAAAMMFRGGIRAGDSAEEVTAPAPVLLLATAAGVGLLTGLVGIGGGFLIVPALVLLARMPMKQAVGTSLLTIGMNSAAGFAGYAGRVAVPWGFIAGFTLIALLGAMAGTALVRVVPQAHLKRAFAVLLVGIGLFTLWQNRTVFGWDGGQPATSIIPSTLGSK